MRKHAWGGLAMVLAAVFAGGTALCAEEAVEGKLAVGTVTERGLCVAVKPTKEAFAATEPLTFDVTLTNVSEKAFQLFDATYWLYEVNSGGSWACILKDAATGKEYRPTAVVRPLMERITAPVALEPGKSRDVKMDLTRALSYPPAGENAGFQPAPVGPGPRLRGTPLPPATYKLGLTLTFIKSAGFVVDEKPDAMPFWLGTVKVETVPFKAGAAGAEAPAGWQKLFADEDWYKNHEAQERLFTGVLNAIKQDPDMATTLQRTSLYSLGRRTIYTHANKVDALDKLVGKVVTIRGKAVDMELEGHAVREIWPAAVMEAKEPLHPIEVHEIKATPEQIDPPPILDPQPIRREEK